MKTISFGAVAWALSWLAGCVQQDRAAEKPAEKHDRVAVTLDPAVDRATLDLLPTEAIEATKRAPVRVLVPPDRTTLSRAIVIAEPAFYAFFASEDGANVSLQGVRALGSNGSDVNVSPGIAVRGNRALVTETDAIWTVSWVENEVAYALTVECARSGDPRCVDRGYALELANRLAYVGGRSEGSR